MTKCKNNNNIHLDNCKHLLANKRKNTFIKQQKVYSHIDVLEGMLKFNYSALKVINEIVLYDYINFHILKNGENKLIFEINKLPGIKVSFNILKCNAHIIFKLTSRYLRKVVSCDIILEDIQSFFQMVDHEVTTDELRNSLFTYSFEATVDLVGVSYIRICEDLLEKINNDIVMRRKDNTRTPRVKINSSTPINYKKISLKLEPYYFEDKMFNDGSSFIIYNKLNDMVENCNNSSHWWCHYAHILQLDEQELSNLFLYINKLDKNELEEVYRLLANNLHSIMRIEYKINRRYIRQLLKKTRKKPLDSKFNYMVNAYDLKEELFLYFTSIYNISVNNKKATNTPLIHYSLKYRGHLLHTKKSMVKTVPLNNTYFHPLIILTKIERLKLKKNVPTLNCVTLKLKASIFRIYFAISYVPLKKYRYSCYCCYFMYFRVPRWQWGTHLLYCSSCCLIKRPGLHHPDIYC